MTKHNRKTWIYPAVLLVISLAYRLMAYLQQFDFRMRPDDFGPLVYPAYLAGYDWSQFNVGRSYYGFGYYWIFAPLFKLIRSPKTLLLTICLINAVLVAVSSLLVYHLLRRYLSLPAGWMTCAIALLATLFQGDVGQRDGFWLRTDNEIPFYFICWFVVWVFLAAFRASHSAKEQAGKRMGRSLGMAALLCWGLTVHERAVAVLLAVAFLELLYYFFRKKWLFQPVVFYGSLAVLFVCQRLLRSAVIRTLWAGGWPVKNTSIFSGAGLWFLKSAVGMKALLIVLWGNLHSFMIRGFGLPAFALSIGVFWLVKQFVQRSKQKTAAFSSLCEAGADTGALIRAEGAVLIILLFGICVVITIVGLGLNWGGKLAEGMAAGEIVYEYKSICYSRYYYLFIGPIVCSLLALLFGNVPLKRSLVEAGWAVFGLIEIAFFAFVFPYCVKAGKVYVRRTLGTYFVLRSSWGNQVRLFLSLMAVLLVMILFTLAMRSKAGSVKKWVACAAVAALLISAADRFAQIDSKGYALTFTEGEAAAELLVRADEADALPDHVYVPNIKSSCSLQYLAPKLHLIAGEPAEEQIKDNSLVLCLTENESYEKAGYSLLAYGDYFVYSNDPAFVAFAREVEDEADHSNTVL